jgi:polyribonucleotide nucleotidyltransferase
MSQTLAEPREDIAPNAPRIVTIKINPDKIRDIIGPGGKMIRAIVEETGAKIDVETTARFRLRQPTAKPRKPRLTASAL